jgi:hypothetical protein
MPPIPKQHPKKLATKPLVVKRVPAKKGSLAEINAAAAAAHVVGGEHAREVFDESRRGMFLFFFPVNFARSR